MSSYPLAYIITTAAEKMFLAPFSQCFYMVWNIPLQTSKQNVYVSTS